MVVKKLELFLEIPPQNIVVDKNKKSNVGVKLRQSKWLISINKFNRGLNKIGIDLYAPFLKRRGLTPFYIIARKLNWIPDKPLKLPLEMQQYIKEKYSNDLDWTKNYIENQSS